MAPCGLPTSPTTDSKDSASKRKRANRLAKLKQCKREARREREQCLSHQDTERHHGEEILHADTDPCINDPGEVIHPKPAETEPLLPHNPTITWASLLNSGITAQMQQNLQRTHPSARVLTPELEPDPEATSKSWVNLRIKRTDQKDLCRDISPGFTCDGCGDTDASPKSCGDRSPKSKESKVGRGSRRSRGHRRRNSKENECFHSVGIKGQGRHLEGKRADARGQEQAEDGWEAAADTLSLHTMEKKKFLNVLQPQAPPLNNQQRTRSSSAPLLGLKPRKQQQNAHGRAWMQGDLRRPTCLPSPTKQQKLRVDARTITNLNDVSEKLQCLVCTEDLDNTDTSFGGCECGFNICLFCYYKIAQETGRCPGCRGVYKRDVAAKPACLLPR